MAGSSQCVRQACPPDSYPPDLEAAAVELVLQQAQALGESWAAA